MPVVKNSPNVVANAVASAKKATKKITLEVIDYTTKTGKVLVDGGVKIAKEDMEALSDAVKYRLRTFCFLTFRGKDGLGQTVNCWLLRNGVTAEDVETIISSNETANDFEQKIIDGQAASKAARANAPRGGGNAQLTALVANQAQQLAELTDLVKQLAAKK